MGRSRGAGLVGLLWSAFLVVILLSAADLMRGRDSTLRAWWSDLRSSPSGGTALKKFFQKPGSLRTP